jgi:hypothetical protein
MPLLRRKMLRSGAMPTPPGDNEYNAEIYAISAQLDCLELPEEHAGRVVCSSRFLWLVKLF